MEILNSIQASEKWLGFISLILTIAALVYAIRFFTDYNLIYGFVAALLCIAFLAVTVIQFQTPTRTQYEVSFDDNYPVSELIENYEIVDQRGDILIVEEKSR